MYQNMNLISLKYEKSKNGRVKKQQSWKKGVSLIASREQQIAVLA